MDREVRSLVGKGRELVLHFGMPKTGSTSIQASLFNWKCDDTSWYLNDGKPNPSGSLALGFSPKSDWPPILQPYSAADGVRLGRSFVHQLEAQLDNGYARYIFSSEYLTWKRFPAQGLRRFLSWAKSRVDRIRAVGYVREPVSYMESLFQQWLKQDALYEESISLGLEPFYPNYRKAFSVLEDLLGADNVSYWPFDGGQLLNGCVVSDFAHRLGLDIEKGHIEKKNASLSAGAVCLLYAFNKSRSGNRTSSLDSGINEKLLDTLSIIGSGRLRFSPDLIEPILRQNAADLAWMESRLGVALTPQYPDDASRIRDEHDVIKLAEEAMSEVHFHRADPGMRAFANSRSPHELIEQMILSFGADEIAWISSARLDQRPIFVWGAGAAGQRLLAQLREQRIDIAGIIDSDTSKHGLTICGIKVIAPDVFLTTILSDTRSKPAILIASTYHEEIRALLARSGFDTDRDCRISGTSGTWI